MQEWAQELEWRQEQVQATGTMVQILAGALGLD
jgi:hypothetical protein